MCEVAKLLSIAVLGLVCFIAFGMGKYNELLVERNKLKLVKGKTQNVSNPEPVVEENHDSPSCSKQDN